MSISIAQERSREFVHELRVLNRQPSNLADLGLAIIETGSEIDIYELEANISVSASTKLIVYDVEASDEQTIKSIIVALESGLWPVLYIQKDIGSPLLNQLQHLANSNNLQVSNTLGQELFEMELPGEVRVIVVVDRDLVENHITYPHFFGLFGPIMRV